MSLADPDNSIFSIAFDFVNSTSRSVFLTGKAGTGKTTFLKYVSKNTHKSFAVAAPTGVAAINAGGMTLHSLFQLPFGVYMPGYREVESTVLVTNRNTLFKNLRLSNAKRTLLQELELLIIDEVSMVRCDMLDAIDAILRAVRRNQNPFGGIQVLFIGDLYQLSPVVGTEEWSILKEHYESPFFFHSNVVQQAQPLCIELTKIYRQSEQLFINLLNNIRNNEVTQVDLQLLNSRQQIIENTDGYVVLTTHNVKADVINQQELQKLGGEIFNFSAVINDDFPERIYPTDPALVFKKGARIMFIKNDTSGEKNYYNGKVATINDIDEDSVTVKFEDGTSFELTTETWRNIRYTYNTEKDEIEEEELGSFTQYPVRLAWAITIHKSQGLTFQKAIVDAGSSFAPGQVYVALSRCTSLEGLILNSRITDKQIVTDPVVVAYSKYVQSEAQLSGLFQKEKEEYEKQCLINLFDFSKLRQAIAEWGEEVPKKKLPSVPEVGLFSKQLIEKSNELDDVALKTRQWIDKNFNEAHAQNDFTKLENGLSRSVAHFNMLLHDDFFIKLQEHLASLKSKSKVKKYTKEVSALAAIIAVKAKKLQSAKFRGKLLAHENIKIFGEALVTSIKTEKPKVNSAWESKLLFDRGISLDGIASARGLAISTIEGHLAQFVKTGELPINKLVGDDKIIAIQKVIEEIASSSFSVVKRKLGDDYSYSEIRMVINHLEYLKFRKEQ